MASGRVHRSVGAVSGVAAALYSSQGQESGDQLIEGLAGIVGGIVGGLLPDKLEPPISSWHRGPAHSPIVGSSIVLSIKQVQRLADHGRERSAHYRNLGVCPSNWFHIDSGRSTCIMET